MAGISIDLYLSSYRVKTTLSTFWAWLRVELSFYEIGPKSEITFGKPSVEVAFTLGGWGLLPGSFYLSRSLRPLLWIQMENFLLWVLCLFSFFRRPSSSPLCIIHLTTFWILLLLSCCLLSVCRPRITKIYFKGKYFMLRVRDKNVSSKYIK